MEQKKHIFRRFDAELKKLHGMITEMGKLVGSQMEFAVEVLHGADIPGARDLIARDADINDLDNRADEELVLLIAKRQPMASDLRQLITFSKIVNDLERCGDEIRKVGRLVLHLYDNDMPPPNTKLLTDVYALADLSASMLHRVMQAYEDGNLELALDVLGREEQLEDAFEGALRRLSTYVLEDPRNIGHSIHVTLTLRALERVGGHAKNIAGYLVYLATGEDVRHKDLHDVEKVVNGAA